MQFEYRRFNHDPCIAFFALILVAMVSLYGQAAEPAEVSIAVAPSGTENELQRVFSNKQMLLCFQGKGASVPFDAGVLREMYDRVPAVRENRVIVTGNSSGAVLAAFFSCFGFTPENLAYCEHRLLHTDVSPIRKLTQGSSLASKLLRGQPTELDHEALREYIACALAVEDSSSARTIDEVIRRARATPRFPMLIAAGNKEVLENRASGELLSARDYKEFDPHNYSVSWKPEVFEYYQQHPDKFVADNPGLRLGPDRYIGKAMTYFVDQSMFDLLSRIPVEERTGDLRLVTTSADLAMAILASASEPTYFLPVVERDPSKLMTRDELGDLGTTTERRYCGGMFMMMPAQDIRRVLPGLRVFGTGWTPTGYPVTRTVQSWYLVDDGLMARLNGWWADLELQLTPDLQQRIIMDRNLTSQQIFEAGLETARAGLDADHGLQAYVAAPYYDGPTSRALWFHADRNAALERLPNGHERLKTIRGLGPLKQK
jgi:hypothetical protein